MTGPRAGTSHLVPVLHRTVTCSPSILRATALSTQTLCDHSAAVVYTTIQASAQGRPGRAQRYARGKPRDQRCWPSGRARQSAVTLHYGPEELCGQGAAQAAGKRRCMALRAKRQGLVLAGQWRHRGLREEPAGAASAQSCCCGEQTSGPRARIGLGTDTPSPDSHAQIG